MVRYNECERNEWGHQRMGSGLEKSLFAEFVLSLRENITFQDLTP